LPGEDSRGERRAGDVEGRRFLVGDFGPNDGGVTTTRDARLTRGVRVALVLWRIIRGIESSLGVGLLQKCMDAGRRLQAARRASGRRALRPHSETLLSGQPSRRPSAHSAGATIRLLPALLQLASRCLQGSKPLLQLGQATYSRRQSRHSPRVGVKHNEKSSQQAPAIVHIWGERS
jgi:hypothetical protein